MRTTRFASGHGLPRNAACSTSSPVATAVSPTKTPPRKLAGGPLAPPAERGALFFLEEPFFLDFAEPEPGRARAGDCFPVGTARDFELGVEGDMQRPRPPPAFKYPPNLLVSLEKKTKKEAKS